jgi:hypothetical protein
MTARRNAIAALVLALLAAALLAQNADAQKHPDIRSANFMVPACQRFLASFPRSTPSETFDEGVCAGVMRGLYGVTELLLPQIKSCPPNGVTSEQMVRVVVSYIERRPERMHENFVSLAIEAVHQAWPCK